MRQIFSVGMILTVLVALLSFPATVFSMEKLSDERLREITGQAGFIESEEDLEVLESARNDFVNLVRSQGLQKFLAEETRNKLINNTDVKPEKQAELLQKTTRDLLQNPDFLREVAQAGRALAQLSESLRKLNGLQ